jgi:cytolysin-activating lysine-acyltransferase
MIQRSESHVQNVAQKHAPLAPPRGSDHADRDHQRKSSPMSDQAKSGNPANVRPDQPAPRGTIFDQPAPIGAAKKTSEVLGEITWLMSQSPLHKQLFISNLEWLVMTPMLLQQLRLFYDQTKPVGVVFWASVSEEVEARLAAGNARMRPQDWKSGDRLWVVEVIAPFGKGEEMVRDLKEMVFPGRDLKAVTIEHGNACVRLVRRP